MIIIENDRQIKYSEDLRERYVPLKRIQYYLEMGYDLVEPIVINTAGDEGMFGILMYPGSKLIEKNKQFKTFISEINNDKLSAENEVRLVNLIGNVLLDFFQHASFWKLFRLLFTKKYSLSKQLLFDIVINTEIHLLRDIQFKDVYQEQLHKKD